MKKVKILTILLAIILIIMIGFFGIYAQNKNIMENKIKNYSYAMDLSGIRTVRLELSDESETVIKDSEGKEVEDAEDLTDEELQEKGYVKEEVPYNSEEIKTVENYERTKNIIEKRLQGIETDNYNIKLNEQTGEIVVEATENDKIEGVLSVLNTQGKFEIKDSETNEVIINNDNIKSAKVTSAQTKTGTTIYLELGLNDEASNKIAEIKNSIETETEDTEDNVEENTTDANTTEDEATSEDEEEKADKKANAYIDGQSITEFSIVEQKDNNKLRIPIGEESSNTTTLNEHLSEASYVAFMIDSGNIPLTYEMAENQYIVSDITSNEIKTIVYVAIAIIAIALIILIIKHKFLGLFVAISYIGFIAALLLAIRELNVVLAVEGFAAIAIILFLNYILVKQLLKEEKMETYKEFFIKILPLIILSIIFSYVKWAPISSFGMILVWGIVLIAIYNMIITSNLIKVGKEK